MSSMHFFEEALDYSLKNNPWIAELVLVNDGSNDGTPAHLEKLITRWKQHYDIDYQLINIKPNQGKGNALREGILAAKGDWMLTIDGDAAFSPMMINEWYENNWIDWEEEDSVYIGSRELGGKKGWVKFKWHRRIIGRIFSLIVRSFTGIKEPDTQCGFKLYPKLHGKQVFENLEDKGFAHDVEVIFKLNKAGVNIQSLPIRCVDRGDSKVNIVTDSVRMFRHVVRIWWKHR